MIQSSSQDPALHGVHAGIIMDGNGRWAARQGLGRAEGHRAGALAVHRAIAAAHCFGIGILTLFAFSEDNWERPPREVRSLLGIFEDFLRDEAEWLRSSGIRLSVIGRRDRLPRPLFDTIRRVEELTAGGRSLDLRLAIDYSGRQEILRAARLGEGSRGTAEEFSRLLAEASHAPSSSPDLDLLIRTGGERRLSDLPLWEAAYAELYFTDRMWPDFDASDLALALDDFSRRERRFGRIPDWVARGSSTEPNQEVGAGHRPAPPATLSRRD
jgi:undecaprenyl diphosphate synthase